MKEIPIYTDLEKTIDQIQKVLMCHKNGPNSLVFNNSMGKGKFLYFLNKNGVDFLIYEIELNEAVLIKRVTADQKIWVLNMMFGEVNPLDSDGNVGQQIFSSQLHNFKQEYKVIFNERVKLYGGTARFYPSYFDRNYSKLESEFSFLGQSEPFGIYEIPSPEMHSVLRSCFDLRTDSPIFEHRLFAKSVELINVFMDQFWRREVRQGLHHLSELEIYKLLDVQRLFTNYKSPPSLKDISTFIGVGTTKTNKLFKEVYGTTPHKFFADKRMNEAYNLLLQGKYNISEIGTFLGFANMSHFSREFKRHFGKLPKSFQMELKESKKKL